MKGNDSLRKSMIQNVITLEFNKDISQMMSKYSTDQKGQEILKEI